MLILVLWLVVVGFVVGLIARAVVPGRDHMGVLGTTLLGLAGSIVGGVLFALLFQPDRNSDGFQPAGFIGSIIGAVLVLLLFRAANRRRVW